MTRLILAIALLAASIAAPADQYLKLSTASQEVFAGPFVDDTDFKTAETALSIANTDVKLLKAGATSEANKNSGGCTHIASGRYYCVLDATDTNTLGTMRLSIKMSGALDVWENLHVLSANAYDDMFGATIPQVDVRQFGGSAGSFAGGVPAVNASQISTDSGAADRLEALLDSTCGSYPELGVLRGIGCTAQAYTAGTPSITLDSSASFGDNTLTGATIIICGSTQGYCQSALAASNVGSTDVVTLTAALPVAASGAVTYTIYGTSASSGGSGLDAAGVRAAVGLASANLDSQLGAIDDYVDTEVAAIKTKTDFLPSATAGAAGGVFIAGTNAATTITTALTTTFTGNLTGSAASVTGAVGSVTGNVGGNVTGSVGSVATGGITAASIATDAIGAAEIASDAGSELGTAAWATTTRTLSAGTNIVLAKGTGITGFNDLDAAAVRTAIGLATANLDTQLSTIDTVADSILDDTGTAGVVVASASKTGYALSAAGVDAIWDEAKAGHVTAGTYGAYLDAAISGVSTGGVSAGDIADAVLDEALSGHQTAGTAGKALSDAAAGGGLDAAGVRAAVGLASANLDTQLAAKATSSALTSVASAIAALNDLSLDDVAGIIIEDQAGGISLRCALAAILSYAGGDLTTAANAPTFRDPSGTETRISGTISSAGNRNMTITCPSY